MCGCFYRLTLVHTHNGVCVCNGRYQHHDAGYHRYDPDDADNSNHEHNGWYDHLRYQHYQNH